MKIKKIILSIACALVLTACGNDSEKELPPSDMYAIDGFTGAYDINELLLFTSLYANGKTYSFDTNKNLYIHYKNLPIFKTEVLRQIITPDHLFLEKSKHLEAYKYWVGSKASFNNDELSYSLSNDHQNTPFIMSWKYKKIDVSGRPIREDSNNPIHRILPGSSTEVVAATSGTGYAMNEVFPQGSVCWQKQSASSSQEYIDFYPKSIITHVEDTQEVVRSGVWNNVAWTEFKRQEGEATWANIKLEIEGDIYWGFYHFKNESLMKMPDQLACDFMNETAFNTAMSKLDKLNEAMQNDGFDYSMEELIWRYIYLKGSQANPVQSDNITEPDELE